MIPCTCDVCELREHLEMRLKALSNIEPLDGKARHARWHRINELEQALQVSPKTPYPDDVPTDARPKSTD